MKFRLEIEIGNDDVQTYPDLARILRGVAKSLRHDVDIRLEDIGDGDGASIRDVNGNRIGKWETVA